MTEDNAIYVVRRVVAERNDAQFRAKRAEGLLEDAERRLKEVRGRRDDLAARVADLEQKRANLKRVIVALVGRIAVLERKLGADAPEVDLATAQAIPLMGLDGGRAAVRASEEATTPLTPVMFGSHENEQGPPPLKSNIFAQPVRTVGERRAFNASDGL